MRQALRRSTLSHDTELATNRLNVALVEALAGKTIRHKYLIDCIVANSYTKYQIANKALDIMINSSRGDLAYFQADTHSS